MKEKTRFLNFEYMGVFLIFSLVSLCFVINMPINNLDEIWKYSWARAITLGYLPYKDFNAITTPLYFFLCSIPLHISNELFMFRITQCLFWGLWGELIYLLLKKDVEKSLALFMSLTCTVFTLFIYYSFDYNALVVLLIFVCLFILEKDYKPNKKFFIIGLLCACAILTKQTIGVALFFGFLISILTDNKQRFLKIKNLLVGTFIPCFVFLIYLLITNSFSSFLDLTLLGLGSFSTNRAMTINNVFYLMFPFVIFVLYLIKGFKSKDNKFIYYIFCWGCIFLISYPIFDRVHFSYFFVFGLFIFFKNYGKIFLQKKKLTIIACTILFFLSFTFTFLKCNMIYQQNRENIVSDINGMKKLPISISTYEFINNIDGYMLAKYPNKKVYYFTSGSCVYSIKHDTCSGYYDLFLLGNLGTKSPIAFVDDIIEENGIIAIVKDYENDNWQNPIEIVPYIEEHFNLIDSCDMFDIYCIKEF